MGIKEIHRNYAKMNMLIISKYRTKKMELISKLHNKQTA